MKAYFDINQPWISRKITSNQNDSTHESLEKTLGRHLKSNFQKAYHPHSTESIAYISEWIHSKQCPVILDSGCGVGEGSIRLAELNPGMAVLAIDKSLLRIEKAKKRIEREDEKIRSQVLFIQADMSDCYREALQRAWPVHKHYILYPCPWPKKKHFKKRWHGHPVFPDMLSLCTYIHLRSDWEIYLKEFAKAVYLLTGEQFVPKQLSVDEAFTPYERKYHMSGYPVYQLEIQLKSQYSPDKTNLS